MFWQLSRYLVRRLLWRAMAFLLGIGWLLFFLSVLAWLGSRR